MNNCEGWGMYIEIHQLKQIGLNISQIARRMDICRGTVSKYLAMTTEEFKDHLKGLDSRQRKLDTAHDDILSWLKGYPELSNSQVLDWLQERLKIGGICEGTVRNYVMDIREKYNIPKTTYVRSYEAMDDPPMGHQMQVDFGEFKAKSNYGNLTKPENLRMKFLHRLFAKFIQITSDSYNESAILIRILPFSSPPFDNILIFNYSP